MQYSELEDTTNFHRNMRKTPFLKLFPHWWDERDPLITAIGDEVERIKALAIFGLLNAGMKPPVLLWQTSLTHDKYNVNKDITQLPAIIELDAPLYKTWGDITLTNNTEDDIDGLEITFNETDGFAINQLISKDDVIKINLTENKVQINNHTIKPQILGKGMPYFLTTYNNNKYIEGTPLHNEVIRLKINTDINLEGSTVYETVNVTEKMDKWEVHGDAYQYNQKGYDPWIALEKGRIGYELNFSDITEITFWYKADNPDGDTCTLNCYADNEVIFSKDVGSSFVNYTIQTKNRESSELVITIPDGDTSTNIITKDLTGVGKLEFEHQDSGTVYLNDIKYVAKSKYHSACDMNVDINLDHAVFINEQNIEVTGLELIPIEKIELYANYDFEYNKERNGWQKVYQKKYDKTTNVVYDMVTTHFFTKEFYVDVWFKTLQYPYRVGFPCYQNAESDSMFHVNNRLDTLGELLGLERRLYRTDIEEEEYYHTFPEYYPFDIEQDYWYYKRLISEYTWNDLAINNVDIQDTDGNNLFTLHSINPFCEDFVVHAKSSYPKDKDFIDYNEYYPILIMQQDTDGYVAQSEYQNIVNLLGHNDYTASVLLNNNSDNNDIVYKQMQAKYMEDNKIVSVNNLTPSQLADIAQATRKNRQYIKSFAHVSKELITFFNLSNLPSDININDISITIEAESTDNKTNKFSNEKTGLLIPNLNGDKNVFIPLTADKSYQLNKQSITYSIDDIDTLQEIISGTDENIIQTTTIGQFEARIGTAARIPFKLEENGIEVTDITQVWVYYNNMLQRGARLETDENGKQYIYTVIPKQIPMGEDNKLTMRIECKSEKHKPSIVKIDIARANKYKEAQTNQETTEKEVEYQYIYGPLTDEGESHDMEYTEEWHTKDIRNIIQKQGLYFRNIFVNTDPQSSTTIILYNIKLEVHYSQKNSEFKLQTYVNVQDAKIPHLGTYEVCVQNTGSKPLKTSVDIITPPNIKLSKNYIDVKLNPGNYIKESSTITAEYPIIDGIYDIFAICGDKTKRDSISVFTDGMIRTSVIIKPHNGKYNEDIKLSADVKTIDGGKIYGNGNQMQFYINGFAVGEPVAIYDNHAETIITPGNYNFTGTGTLRLEARYLGSTKYASSRGSSTIFISKNSTRLTIIAPEKAMYKGAYEARAFVEYFNGEEYKPVNDGHVTFYINDEILSTNAVSDNNGNFIVSLSSLENPPNDYILKVQYEGSNIYASAMNTQNFEIIGGDVDVLVFDEKARPYDNIHLKAKVVDKNNKPILYGYVDFICEELDIDFKNIELKDGIGSTPYFDINVTIEDDDATRIIPFKVIYHGAINDEQAIYNDGEGTGHIVVKKSDAILEYSSLYQASQYEPLGFLVKVKDAETNEYISEGTIEITLPKQNNLKLRAKVDKDGAARLVHNLINFTAKEWQQLTKWSFSTADDNSSGQVNIVNNVRVPEYDGPYNSEYLYKIYDGDYSDITLVDFELSSDGKNLYYVGHKNDGLAETDRDIKEYIFIGDDGCLYAQTDIDEFRKYATGLQNIKIKFISDGGYKSQTITVTNGLNIEPQVTDLDIHSYDLTYTDKDSIICYVTKYNSEAPNVPVTDGKVQFIFDGKVLDTVKVTNGLAILKNNSLVSVPAGNHLLEVDYVKNNKNTTRSYSLFNLRQAVPTISIDVDRVVRNKNTQIIVRVTSEQSADIPLNGLVTLYLNDEKIGEQYLYGNESLVGIVDYEGHITENMIIDVPHAIFNYIMPYDVDIPDKYTLKAIYEGNEFFTASEPAIKHIHEEPAPVHITSQDVDINNIIDVSVNEEFSIDFLINCSDDVIDEGILYLMGGKNNIIAQDYVSDNIATLKWKPSAIKEYSFTLKYDNATHYQSQEKIIRFNSVQSKDVINLPDNHYKSLKQALMCLATNGTIYINEDIELTKSFNIYKNCNLIGQNDTAIINASNKNIEIINTGETHIDNLHFISDNYAMELINNNYLVINRSILDKNILLHNNNDLMAQRNFIYGVCSGTPSDLNNNWWGSNTPPYNVDNHIIIDVEPVNKPAVISEEVDIIGRMIGANGREYLLPEANFTFGADSGYFSVDFGKTTNHQIKTTFLDAEKESKIYFTVDNQTTTCMIYEYERKTEVIIDNIDNLPINYQVPVKAKVQSVADIFYEFDDKNHVTKGTTLINKGHMLFYIDDQQVGYSPVINGEAETIIFLTDKYYENHEYTLKAVYQPDNYYFASEDSTTISIVNDNDICYVSSLGADTNNGNFSSPVKTIKRALALRKNIIYLLDDTHNENNINITYNVTIKSFKNNTKFESINGTSIFNIPRDTLLSIQGVDFSDNTANVIFDNKGTLNINKCILYRNKKIFNNEGEINVRYSAIVDNTQIADTVDASWFVYCWFGQDNPDIPNIDNHVQMTKKASKDVLYIGTLAHVTGMLKNYKHGRLIYKLEEPLPLRIAKFATTYGSMKPIKDYTYHNSSDSLLNTQEANNTKQYIISTPDNTNYIEHLVTLKCYVKDVYDENATGQVNMHISGPGTTIDRTVTLNNGEGLLEINKLSIGKYTLQCTYNNKDSTGSTQIYTSTSNFVVKKPDIIVKKFNILEGDNLYHTKVDIELEDVFGNAVNDEHINVSIDGEYIGSATTKNGIILKRFSYNRIKSGTHTITIDNKNSKSKYDTFTASSTLIVKSKNVQILFPYSGFEDSVRGNIYIDILDDENVNVEGGYIDIELDSKKIVSHAEVVNGNVTVSNFSIQGTGQHSIAIYYSGLEGFYNEKLYINNNISVGIFNVIFGINSNEYVHADIGKPFILDTTITDVSNQLVNIGYVNVYIDDILLNDEPLYVNNGTISLNTDLPMNISSGLYDLRLEYIDSSNTYLDTFLSTFLEVGKIATNINMDVIYGAPGQYTTIEYQVSTTYGSVNSGTLIAKYDDEIIGQSIVTENITNQIVIKTPFVPDTQDYFIRFEYSDETTYADSYVDTRLIIRKNNVDIKPSHTWYYPNTTFHFVGTILDKDGNRINTGKAALYIDNVKETESQDIINGQFITSLNFSKARNYPMSIVYEENDYYSQTSYDFTFKIDSVDIDDISLKDDTTHRPIYYIENSKLYSLPRELIETELVFTTLDNYNVKDGIVDILIDNNTIASYYIAESNKYIEFNVGDIAKGKHTLTIKYYGSALFNNYTKKIPLTILSKQLNVKVNNNQTIITRNHKDSIDIDTVLYDASTNEPTLVTGMLRYYIGTPVYKADITNNTVVDTYDYHFIGVEPLTQKSSHIYSYTLSNDLLEYAIDKYETHYKVKVEFSGDDEYDDAFGVVDLHIQKQDCSLTFNNINEFLEANYRDTININFHIDAQGSPLINFYIDDDLIGSTIAKNTTGTFSYKLNSKYTVKEGSSYYNIRAVFDGSAVDKPAEAVAKMHIHPLMPRMNTKAKTAFYGGVLKLDNVVSDVDGTIITDGTLSYTLGDEHETYNVNTEGTINIPETTQQTLTLHVEYNTTNSNYMIFKKNIDINLQPNDVILSIDMPDEMYRGETYNININAVSDTTSLPINMTFNNEYKMTNGRLTIPLQIPATEPYTQTYNYTIASPGNQFFKPIQTQAKTRIINSSTVTLNKKQPITKTNAKTLEKALDLVAEHGTIQIIDAPDNENVTIEKGVNITGDTTVNNWKITNKAKEVSITGITFDGSASNAIINNGEITIGECTFKNGHDSAIYTDASANIQQCTFMNNIAQDGAGIYISSKNYKTVINQCVFNNNNANGNGSCIYSNKGNDVDILNNRFNNNNGTNGVTSSICANGNLYVSSNSFYSNDYECEIYLISGSLSAENNIFDGSIQSVKAYNGTIDADFNYWGYNNIAEIEARNSGLMVLNNWLLSSRKDYNKEINGVGKSIIVGVIEQYQNRLEKEITTIPAIDVEFPVIVGNATFNLNDEIQASSSATVQIGQEVLR